VLLAFGGALLLFVALAAIGVKLIFDTVPTWLPQPANVSPQSPDLQTAPKQDLTAFRSEEDRQLKTLGWVDRNAGIARIPIDDAMWAVVSNGLPDWSQPGGAGARSDDCALLTAAVPRAPRVHNCQQPRGPGP
jgi:hypothetical protein